MNDLIRLTEAIQAELPEAVVGFDTPMSSQDPTWADIEHEGRSVVVEWRPGVGFGVSLLVDQTTDPTAGLFAGPDRVFRSWQEAKSHVAHLLAFDDQPQLKRFARR